MASSSRHFIPRATRSSNPLLRPRSPDSLDQNPAAKRPCPETASTSTHANIHKLHKGFEREIRNMVNEATANTEIMHGFNYAVAQGKGAKKQRERLNRPDTTWDSSKPHRAVSEDGASLVFHFPGALKEASSTRLFETLVDFAKDIGPLPKCAGADQVQDAPSSYKKVIGQITGIFKVVKAWHAIGHKYDQPTISGDMLKTGKKFNASLELISQLHLVSHRVNDVIKYADPEFYDALVKLRAEAERLHQFLKVIGSGDPLLMEGREIMYNRQTPLHADNSDPKKGWAVLVVVGKFRGGALHIPCLNLHMSYTEGTIIMLRGKILPHEVEAFLDGQRICIAHFTHQSLWDACNMSPP